MQIPEVIVSCSQDNIRGVLNEYLGCDCVDNIISDGSFSCVTFKNTPITDKTQKFMDSLIKGLWIDERYYVVIQYF
jgi:hypothetical protein